MSPRNQPSGDVFISYRREDTEGQAGRLHDDLIQRLGKGMVFLDVDDIRIGDDFRIVLESKVSLCRVLLVVIGRSWLLADGEGRRRLDNPSDFVRFETALALKRSIPVVPVLVQGAQMPRPESLPDDLRELAFRNGVEITHARWHSDVDVLAQKLRPYLQDPIPVPPPVPVPVPPPDPFPLPLPDPDPPNRSRRNWMIVAVGGLLTAYGAAWKYRNPPPPPPKLGFQGMWKAAGSAPAQFLKIGLVDHRLAILEDGQEFISIRETPVVLTLESVQKTAANEKQELHLEGSDGLILVTKAGKFAYRRIP